jgi:hypothetical protein
MILCDGKAIFGVRKSNLRFLFRQENLPEWEAMRPISKAAATRPHSKGCAKEKLIALSLCHSMFHHRRKNLRDKNSSLLY